MVYDSCTIATALSCRLDCHLACETNYEVIPVKYTGFPGPGFTVSSWHPGILSVSSAWPALIT